MIAIAQRASRHAIRQARSWGWPFALGVAALAVAGAFAVALAPQVRRDAQELGAAADRALKRATTQGTRTGPTDRPVESAPRRFLESFPGEDARQARLATLLELAGHHALEVQRSDFELAQDKESGLLRYSLRMPLTGSYAQLRGFLADALGSDAALSLDKLRLRRASAGSPAVEADLTWSFYMRPGSMAVPGSPR